MAEPVNGQSTNVSLPSLRVDAFTVGIASELQKGRRTGLTFAPEAGSWRMRQVINKLIREEDLYGAVGSAYSQGWRRVKLYFLTGLPTETDVDTLGIAELARNCLDIGREHTKNPNVTVSVGGFVPKPFTPFQWFGQNTQVELQRKVSLLRDDLRKNRGVQLKWHDPKASVVEGLTSRGDRRLGAVIEDVWRNGGTFQEWSERFSLDLWTDAMAKHGLDFDWYVHRHRTEDEVLPWDHLSAGLHKDFLWQDWRDALDEVGLEDCRWTPCYDCGACTGYSIEHIVASATPPAGGSQGTGQDLRHRRRGADHVEATTIVGSDVRIRLRFTKLGKIRFVGHRDVARILERSLRRAALPLAMTEGFSPRPKMHFGLALSTGYESFGEYMDVDLRPDEAAGVQIGALPGQLTALLPPGLTVEAAAVIDRGETSLQQAVTSCSWQLDIVGVAHADVAERIARMLARETIPVTRERKGQKVHDDLRPTVLRLEVVGDHIETELSTQPRGVRPSELLAALDPPLPDPITEGGRVCRTHQWITTQSTSTGDGARREPLHATSAPHAKERAS